MTKEKKIETIAKHYGYSHQKQKAIQEMAELTLAITKLDETSQADGKLYVERLMNLMEETADVMIMVQQLAILTNKESVEMVVDEKLNRQLKRIEEEEKRL